MREMVTDAGELAEFPTKRHADKIDYKHGSIRLIIW